jgi:hypothetical protein
VILYCLYRPIVRAHFGKSQPSTTIILSPLNSLIPKIEQSKELESSTNSEGNIPTDKPYPKLSKATSGYLEIEHFKHADLHAGYFCYNCTYFIKGKYCAIVQESGPDVNGAESKIIAPYGVCTLWHPNEKEIR